MHRCAMMGSPQMMKIVRLVEFIASLSSLADGYALLADSSY
jgi:hypothetical protein